MQKAIREALDRVGQERTTVRPLEPTIGDEFQGVFRSVADASRATLLIRLELLASVGADSRYGIGRGELTVLDDARAPVSQDGPGWWAARAAIERSKSEGESSRTAFVRTRIQTWRPGAAPPSSELDAAVNGFLTCRDSIVQRMSDRGRRLLLGQMRGCSQSELAVAEGITQSAVSQALAASDAYAVLAAHAELEGWSA